MSIIYRITEEAERNGWDWDEILYRGAIETVEEFEDYQEAVISFDGSGYDEDYYGVW